MLKDIVKAIDSGRAARKEDLAAIAGTDPSAVDGMLDFLVNRGYLKVDDGALPSCGHCGRCCGGAGCGAGGRRYVLTEKGRKMAGAAPTSGP